MNDFPKFQWSVFVKNGKDQQYVVRADTFEEFQANKEKVLMEVGKDLLASGANVAAPAKIVAPSKPEPVEEPSTCEVCGSPAVERRGVSKHGKPYHGIFCSTKDENHTRWIRP